MPEGDTKRDDGKNDEEAYDQDMPHKRRPANQRVNQYCTYHSPSRTTQQQVAFGKQQQPEHNQAYHQRPANKLDFSHPFDEVSNSKDDQTQCQGNGTPVEESEKEAREWFKQRATVPYREHTKQQDRQPKQQDTIETLLMMRFHLLPLAMHAPDEA